VSTVWIVSLVLAWVVIALLVASMVVLLRHLGELRAQVAAGVTAAPAGPTEVELYDPVDPVELAFLHDGGRPAAAVPLGGVAQDEPLLLVVHAPGCESCEGIEEALEALVREDPPTRVLSVLALREDAARGHLEDRPLDGVPTVRWDDLPEPLRPETTPGLIAVAAGGTVAALGSPTTLADLREAAHVAANAVLVAGPDSIVATGWGHAVPAWGADDPLHIVHVDPDQETPFLDAR
jgi:hypothetical protein